DAVAMIRQHFAESGGADRPAAGLRHLVLEIGADAELADRALPALAARAALIAEAAQVVATFPEQVTVARDVKARRAAAVIVAVLEPVERALGADPEVMVHQVVAELTGAAAEAAGPDVRGRAHQQPCGIQRRRAQE